MRVGIGIQVFRYALNSSDGQNFFGHCTQCGSQPLQKEHPQHRSDQPYDDTTYPVTSAIKWQQVNPVLETQHEWAEAGMKEKAT